MLRKMGVGGVRSMLLLVVFLPCCICSFLLDMSTFLLHLLSSLPLTLILSHVIPCPSSPTCLLHFPFLSSNLLPRIFCASLSSALLHLLLLLMAFEAN